ncbi:uncharacterized protein LOC8030481 [Ixodes scapularis]|uniref:uncharacterized protein LOC8030481 n=1 Tax=Ixodes scapularis TaxID=6945 RepID=UPI001A9E9906|nr:uncharacterized protein LOC8030481 [Ixodes scapularis]
MNVGAALLPGCEAILCFINIILQLVSLPPSHWGTFQGLTEFGSVLERGHFGLWWVCAERVPFFFEDCDSPSSRLSLTGLSTAAGVLAVFHLLALLGFLPLALIRVVQLARNLDEGCFDARFMCLTKITVAVVALVLAVVVVVLGSMGTEQPRFYQVQRDWAFWIQVVILVIDIFLVLICALENIQFWRLQTMREAATASSSYREGDDFSETYSNPNFDRGPPAPYPAQVPQERQPAGSQPPYEPQPTYDSQPTYNPQPTYGAQRDDDDENGSTAMLPPPPPPPPLEGNGTDGIVSSGSRTVISVNNGADLTYQNPTFEERSPTQRRRPNGEPRYGNV